MRTTWLALAILGTIGVAGCGSDDADHGAIADMAVPDLAHGGGDMVTPTACNPTDPMNDGTSCSAPGGCPTGTVGVNLGGTCKCYSKCTVNPDCSCNRLCDPVTLPNDGGQLAACLPGNAPGTRCGRDSMTNQGFGNIFCSQLAVCINADQALMFRYCNYKCETQADCPAQTTCQPYSSGNMTLGNVCAYNSGPNGNKNQGDACMFTDVCKTGLLCSGNPGTCAPQCDGPGATCATGTCTEVDDTASGKVIGWVCK